MTIRVTAADRSGVTTEQGVVSWHDLIAATQQADRGLAAAYVEIAREAVAIMVGSDWHGTPAAMRHLNASYGRVGSAHDSAPAPAHRKTVRCPACGEQVARLEHGACRACQNWFARESRGGQFCHE